MAKVWHALFKRGTTYVTRKAFKGHYDKFAKGERHVFVRKCYQHLRRRARLFLQGQKRTRAILGHLDARL